MDACEAKIAAVAPEIGTEGPILDPKKTSNLTRTKLHRIKGVKVQTVHGIPLVKYAVNRAYTEVGLMYDRVLQCMMMRKFGNITPFSRSYS